MPGRLQELHRQARRAGHPVPPRHRLVKAGCHFLLRPHGTPFKNGSASEFILKIKELDFKPTTASDRGVCTFVLGKSVLQSDLLACLRPKTLNNP